MGNSQERICDAFSLAQPSRDDFKRRYVKDADEGLEMEEFFSPKKKVGPYSDHLSIDF